MGYLSQQTSHHHRHSHRWSSETDSEAREAFVEEALLGWTWAGLGEVVVCHSSTWDPIRFCFRRCTRFGQKLATHKGEAPNESAPFIYVFQPQPPCPDVVVHVTTPHLRICATTACLIGRVALVVHRWVLDPTITIASKSISRSIPLPSKVFFKLYQVSF